MGFEKDMLDLPQATSVAQFHTLKTQKPLNCKVIWNTIDPPFSFVKEVGESELAQLLPRIQTSMYCTSYALQ